MLSWNLSCRTMITSTSNKEVEKIDLEDATTRTTERCIP